MITNKDTIIESASIVDIIGKFVSLEKRGSSHVGLCPFHKEKTPSFNVSETKGIYKCFGCDASGDAVQFLMDNQGMTFPESLEYIAQFTNVEPEYVTQDQRPEITRKKKQEKKEKQQLLDAIAQVGQIFWENSSLKADENDEVLISERVYKKGTIERFRVCLPPTGLFSKDLNTDILQKIGVLNAHGKDFFFDRILFPIQDYKGQLVGFAGRTTQNDNAGTPKYINTKDTPIYKKEGVLYGLHQAKRAIRSTDLAIVTEGYTDVLTLHENGFENSVATCGTAFTEKQAQLLKKYTKNILLLRDGDEAGRKATIRDVETAVRAGINPRICILENKEDPDSLVRKHKGPGFRELLNDKEQDGIIWRVMEEWSDSNNFQKEKAIETAGELLSYLSEPMQETYLRDLCQKKRMGAIKITLRKVIKRKSDARLKTQKLDTQQIEDIVNYGIYEKGRRYFISTDHENGRGYSISNFTIKPLLLIIGANYSLRLIEIINVFGRSAILNLESSAMTSMTEFKRAVEGKGNFVFSGKANAYDRVKAKVYRDFVDCFPINTMGQHREGFYTWGNGISIDGQFKSIDENGIVIHNETKYFLPAFSRIQEKIKSDDMEEEFEFEKKWCYHSTPKAISFEEWSRRMVEVHGTNGGIAVSFYLASLYRDIIFSKFNFFPILNHFGPSGSGKSFCAQSVMAMFGKGDQHDPFNLSSGTNVAFFRRLAQVRNGVVFFDEYSNNVDHRRIEAIKGSYDGAGRQKGVASTDNRTVTTKIRAALLVAGQEQATKDIASFKRMVSLNFKRGTNSLAQQIAAEKLKDLEKTGSLTQITQKLLTYREWVAQEFRDHFIAVKKIFTEAIQKDGHNIEDRLLNNHLIFLTIAVVINKKEKFGFDMEDLSAWIFRNMITQAESIRNEDELSIFWRIFDYLVQSNQACDGKDFCVEMQDSETYLDPSSKVRKDSLLRDYGKPTPLLYLTFSKVHPDYQERHQRQRSKNGLDLQALLYYLTNSDAYEGKKKAKRIGKRVKTVYVFDTDKLPIQIDLSTKEEF